MRTCGTLLFCLSLAGAAPDNCDTSAIRWYLPHQFNEARAAATKQKRLLILKGIAFGVDADGAKCATAGNW